MPDQIQRLLVVVVLAAAAFVAVRVFLIPDTFGEKGHYRTAAIDSAKAEPLHYAGHQACYDCHDEIGELKNDSYHRQVNCEACHGPALDHIESFGEILPSAPRDRGYCTLCHEYNPAKPTGFPQIDPVVHNPIRPCISCHDPHAPDPPLVLNDCSACHGNISRTKALSPHALLDCKQCHTVKEEHKVNPRLNRPSKPTERSDCTTCHAVDADSDRFIPSIDDELHGEGYLCWQCHYPHYPETN